MSATEDGALRASAHWLGITEVDCERLWREILGDAPRASKDTGGTTSQNQAEAGGEPVVPPDLATYYASILGVQVTASATEMKRAYREKAKQYHPDVVTHKGPVFAREAEEKFKELSRAYAFLRGGAIAT